MSEEERQEFRNLKFARAEQGFFTAEQKERYDHLFDLHRVGLKLKLMALDKKMDEIRLSKIN